MARFTTSDLSRKSGDIIAEALRKPVTITQRNKPRLVLLSIEDYRRLTARGDTRKSGGDDLLARGEPLACCQVLIDRAFSRKNKRGDGHDRCLRYGLHRAGDRLARRDRRDPARLEVLVGMVAGAESLLPLGRSPF